MSDRDARAVGVVRQLLIIRRDRDVLGEAELASGMGVMIIVRLVLVPDKVTLEKRLVSKVGVKVMLLANVSTSATVKVFVDSLSSNMVESCG